MRPAPPGFGASGSPQRGCECWRGCGDRGMPAPRSWWVPLPVGALVPRELCLQRGCATHPELPAFIPAVLQSPWTPSSGHQCVPAGLAGAMGREQGSSLPSPHKLAAAEGRQDPACCMLPCASDIPVCPSSGRDIPVPFPSWGGRRSVQSSPCNNLEHCTCAEPHGIVLALPAPASPPRPQGCDPLPRAGQGTLPPPASPASLLFEGREGAPPALRAPSLCTGTLHGHPMAPWGDTPRAWLSPPAHPAPSPARCPCRRADVQRPADGEALSAAALHPQAGGCGRGGRADGALRLHGQRDAPAGGHLDPFR